MVPGHRDVSQLDAKIAIREGTIQYPGHVAQIENALWFTVITALSSAATLGISNDHTGAPYHAVKTTADHLGADVVILDLNPNAGILNRCLVMTSHYFIVPAIADFLSTDCLMVSLAIVIDFLSVSDQSTQIHAYNLLAFGLCCRWVGYGVPLQRRLATSDGPPQENC